MSYIIIGIVVAIIGILIGFILRYKADLGEIKILMEEMQKNNIATLNEQCDKELQKIKEQYYINKKEREKELEDLKEYYKMEKLQYDNNFIKTTIAYNQKMNELKENKTKVEFELKVLEDKKEHLNQVLNTYYESEQNRIEDKIQNITTACIEEMMRQVGEKSIECKEQIKKFQDVLLSYQQRQAAVNEAIMRERQLQEQSEFYKINLSQSEIDDLLMIKELSPRFNNRELLNKIVYESYVKRPLQEMIKRVLGGRSPSGIYKITRKSTGEIYIGRAVAVDKRWTEHVKMAFSIGSIAHSTLHTLMEKDGIWNFTFELLEEVPKEQLNEREKYYIDFYDSKNFGMNQRSGG